MYEEYNNTYQTVQNEPPRKRRNGWKVVLSIGIAVTLGVIAGVCCFGVNYLGNMLIGEHKTGYNEPVSLGIEEEDVSDAPVIQDKDIQISVYDVSDMVQNVISSVVACFSSLVAWVSSVAISLVTSVTASTGVVLSFLETTTSSVATVC